MSIRQVCRCGHEKATHFGDEHEGACLGLGCNVEHMNCRRYRDENDRTPSTLPPPAHARNHPFWCRCYDCKVALGMK